VDTVRWVPVKFNVILVELIIGNIPEIPLLDVVGLTLILDIYSVGTILLYKADWLHFPALVYVTVVIVTHVMMLDRLVKRLPMVMFVLVNNRRLFPFEEGLAE